MAGPSSNDNSAPPEQSRDFSDAQGYAALLLVESLIHGLIEKSVITLETAVDIVEVALSVSLEVDEEPEKKSVSPRGASALLQAISKSLSADLPKS